MSRSIGIMLGQCLTTFTAQASLLGRAPATPNGTDYQAYYDTDLNITWLADANYAVTNFFGVGGVNPGGYMTWETAQSWIGAMKTANFLGANDWRLPTISDIACVGQYNCTGSEMGFLFNSELSGVAGSPISVVHGANYSLFSNIRDGGGEKYWSHTEYTVLGPQFAYTFYFGSGLQSYDYKSDNGFAWAMRPGDIAAVPMPAAACLLPSALGLLGWVRRKQATHSA